MNPKAQYRLLKKIGIGRVSHSFLEVMADSPCFWWAEELEREGEICHLASEESRKVN